MGAVKSQASKGSRARNTPWFPNESRVLRYRILGPLEVCDVDGTALDLTSGKLRALLCALLVSAGQPVSLDRMITSLWRGEPPAAATATLQAYVWQLRRLLEPEREPRQPPTTLVTRPSGYELVVRAGELDADELERLIVAGNDAMTAARFANAEDLFAGALALRRGVPFADVANEPFAVGAVARLNQLLLLAGERRIDALLAQGKVGAATADLELLVDEHPLRERFWAQLIESLYRGDRQGDALHAYQRCRATLADELGVEPGASLRQLERAILAHEPLAAAETRNAVDVERPASGLPAPQPAPASAAGHGFVGRPAELTAISGALSAALAGSGSIVSIEGESGIGKSRLAEEAMRRAQQAGFAATWTCCVDEVGAPMLWPWMEALSALGRAVPSPSVDPDPDTVRFHRVLAVATALLDAARERPTLVVIDDAQWADAVSLRALSLLAGRLYGVHLVVVITVRRPDDRARPAIDDLLADLSRQRSVQRVRLAGLPPADVALLVEDLAGAPVPEALAATVARRTGGNPFFVSELVRLLTSEQMLTNEPGPRMLASVPDSVREVVTRRLARLPEQARTILRLAAVAGPIIELDVLEHATDLDADGLVMQLEVAVLTGMLAEVDDPVGWRFTHGLVQDAVLDSLGRVQRARLHAAIADAIEQVHHHDLSGHLEELAHHCVEAALLRPAADAIRWSTAAALAARLDGRFDRAVRLWQGACRAIANTPSVEPARRFDVLLELARDLRAAGDTQSFGERIVEAFELAGRQQDRRRMALAAAELGWVNLWNTRPYGCIDDATCAQIERLAEQEQDPQLAARLYGAAAVELYYGQRRAYGERLARKAVSIARNVADPALLGRTLNNFVLAAWVPGRDQERLRACSESLAHAGLGLPRQSEVVARLHRAALHLRRHEIALVEADLARCRALVTEVGIAEITAQLAYAETGLATLRGQWDAAEQFADQAYELHSRTKVWGTDWCRAVQLVCIRQAQGRLDEVVDLAVRVAEDDSNTPARPTAVLAVARAGDLAEARRLATRWDWRAEPEDWSWDHRAADWAEAHALLDSPDVADLYARLAPYADRLRVSGTAVACRGSMHGVLGLLARVRGDHDATRRHRDAAVLANRAVGATWWADSVAAELAVV